MPTSVELERRLGDIDDHVAEVAKKHLPNDDLGLLTSAIHDLVTVVRELTVGAAP